ncbi:uncharacterized protein LOC141637772 [Silene latifolia]|uniref:uncharacterized protein LOC141637772 n=1 Tax=Silene latifolia TaxID=37657 RepID=UPI003D772E22
MENASSAKNKVDLIQQAIQQLIESKQPHLHHNNDDDHHHLLTNLLSQLEALKADGTLDPPEPVAESKEASSCKSAETETKGEDETETSESRIVVSESEDVVKELKKLEKQNRVTHWLLSVLILLTVAWQLSEVSLLLKMKEGVTHPFRSIGNMFNDVFKRRRPNDQQQSQLPLVELPDLVVMNDENKS